MTHPIFHLADGPQVTLETLTLGRSDTVDLPQSMRTSGRADVYTDRAADRLILQVRADVYAERLPSQTYHAVVDDPRWATWWDHLKATYRDRWWARAAVRRWPPRHVLTPVPVTVDVAARWKYPDTPVYREGLGRPVVWTETTYRNWGDYR